MGSKVSFSEFVFLARGALTVGCSLKFVECAVFVGQTSMLGMLLCRSSPLPDLPQQGLRKRSGSQGTRKLEIERKENVMLKGKGHAGGLRRIRPTSTNQNYWDSKKNKYI